MTIPTRSRGRWTAVALVSLLAAVASGARADTTTVAGLGWHTDLEEAMAESASSGRPILSLRLLGRLDEELSCANSRFFRLALYPDPEVARRLRDGFVLHWSSERPVPKVSIDFGDGRRLEGTVTGNSVHYLLDARGRPLDALPGMVSPQAFLAWLGAAAPLARRAAALDDAALASELREFHRDARQRSAARLLAELQALGEPDAEARVEVALARRASEAPDGRVSAAAASALTVTKSIAEGPLLAALTPDGGTAMPAEGELPWEALAALPGRGTALDPEVARRAAERADWLGPERVSAVARFERAIALDTVRNEILLHLPLHAWFEESSGPPSFATLNARVYGELFLTSASDPWLGLGPDELFAVLTPAPDDSTRR